VLNSRLDVAFKWFVLRRAKRTSNSLRRDRGRVEIRDRCRGASRLARKRNRIGIHVFTRPRSNESVAAGPSTISLDKHPEGAIYYRTFAYLPNSSEACRLVAIDTSCCAAPAARVGRAHSLEHRNSQSFSGNGFDMASAHVSTPAFKGLHRPPRG